MLTHRVPEDVLGRRYVESVDRLGDVARTTHPHSVDSTTIDQESSQEATTTVRPSNLTRHIRIRSIKIRFSEWT